MEASQPALYQYFVSIKLSKDNREYKWDPAVVDESIRAHNPYTKSDRVRHTLHLTQAILDEAAEAGDLNLVQVSTTDIGASPIIAPLAYLTTGTHFQTTLDVQLPDSTVVFNLKKGAGPIHVLGLHTVAVPMDDLEASEAEDEDEDEETAVDSDNEIEMKETDAEAEAIHRKHSSAETNGTKLNGAAGVVANNEKKRKMDSDEGDGEKEPKVNGKSDAAEIDTHGDDAAAAAGGMKKPKLVEADEKQPTTDEVKPNVVAPA